MRDHLMSCSCQLDGQQIIVWLLPVHFNPVQSLSVGFGSDLVQYNSVAAKFIKQPHVGTTPYLVGRMFVLVNWKGWQIVVSSTLHETKEIPQLLKFKSCFEPLDLSKKLCISFSRKKKVKLTFNVSSHCEFQLKCLFTFFLVKECWHNMIFYQKSRCFHPVVNSHGYWVIFWLSKNFSKSFESFEFFQTLHTYLDYIFPQ